MIPLFFCYFLFFGATVNAIRPDKEIIKEFLDASRAAIKLENNDDVPELFHENFEFKTCKEERYNKGEIFKNRLSKKHVKTFKYNSNLQCFDWAFVSF